ncbi:hypothetical protein [Mesorhizobium sp. M0496]|uniref:hypothetical protein n=1 Tax=Mesorhizobium sp. M0496 TaxID=2956952 RepID=UPI003336941F
MGRPALEPALDDLEGERERLRQLFAHAPAGSRHTSRVIVVTFAFTGDLAAKRRQFAEVEATDIDRDDEGEVTCT